MSETRPNEMCISTRCKNLEQFVSVFHRYVDCDSIFVATLATRPPGFETAFRIQLADGTPVLRGTCTVLESWSTTANPFRLPGFRLGITELGERSALVFKQLVEYRGNATLQSWAPPPPGGTPLEDPLVEPPPPGWERPTLKQGSLRDVDEPIVRTPVLRIPTRNSQARRPVTPALPPLPALPVAHGATPELTSDDDGTTEPIVVPDELPALLAIAPTHAQASDVDDLDDVNVVDPSMPIPIDVAEEVSDVFADGPAEVSEPDVDDNADERRTARTDAAVPVNEIETSTRVVMPANPLARVSSESLEGYVECTLFEVSRPSVAVRELRASDDVLVAPAALASAGELPDRVDDEDMSDHVDAEVCERVDTGVSDRTPIEAPPTVAIDSRANTSVIRMAHASEPPEPVEPRPRRPRWRVPATGLALTIALVIDPSASVFEPAAAPALKATALEPIVPAASAPQPGMAEPPPPGQLPLATPPQECDTAPAPPPLAIAATPICDLEVTSTPLGAAVEVDAEPRGTSPVSIPIACGVHEVTVTHPQYATASAWVTLEPDRGERVEIPLARAIHTLHVATRPGGAALYIDGKRAGTTPTVLEVIGHVPVTLELRKAGYRPTRRDVYSTEQDDHVVVALSRRR